MKIIDIRISVVVPIYNVEKYLKRCLDSIVNQTYKNIEIILVNDGSTDHCSKICDEYQKLDNRVLVIHKKNGGLVSARKAGVAIATGEYILYVDGDDWIEENRVEVLVKNGIKPSQPDMIYLSGHRKDYNNNSVLIDTDIPIKTFYDTEIRKQVFPLLMNVNEVFCIKVYPCLCFWAVKRELLQAKQKLIDNRITIAEDYICIWFCLLSATRVTFIKQDGYHYVQRGSSMVFQAAVSSKDQCSHLKIWYHQLKKYLDISVTEKEIHQIFIYSSIYCLMMADYELLLKRHPQYLYPFTKVKKDSKIIVYGAGRMGHSLVRYLLNTKDYHLVLWVDQNEKSNVLLEHKVSSVETIPEVDYDYIVIAVMHAHIANSIKHSLIMNGIHESKIATMDSNVITENAIPDEFIRD